MHTGRKSFLTNVNNNVPFVKFNIVNIHSIHESPVFTVCCLNLRFFKKVDNNRQTQTLHFLYGHVKNVRNIFLPHFRG